MCGIVGYVGDRQAAEFLLDGLSKLEYRGYDSTEHAGRHPLTARQPSPRPLVQSISFQSQR